MDSSSNKEANSLDEHSVKDLEVQPSNESNPENFNLKNADQLYPSNQAAVTSNCQSHPPALDLTKTSGTRVTCYIDTNDNQSHNGCPITIYPDNKEPEKCHDNVDADHNNADEVHDNADRYNDIEDENNYVSGEEYSDREEEYCEEEYADNEEEYSDRE
ncbi:hypothetical protein CHUAL_013334 [Chamberlinius hualienensis]